MQIVRTSFAQRNSLPLPSAALVIDLRGKNDKLLSLLETEIENLAGEMKTNEMIQWRDLTNFLSYWFYEPMRKVDLNNLRGQQKQAQQQATPTGSTTPQYGPFGPIQPIAPSAPSFFYLPEDHFATTSSGGSSDPFDVFSENIKEILLEMDRIRNNRHKAQGDVDNRGVGGRTVNDSIVRVILLTDVNRPESLGTAAAYAAHLKEEIGKKEREGYAPWLNISVMCLDNSVDVEPPKRLLEELRWNDSWQHLDALIISEKYTATAVRIDGNVQTYLAELLLYILLIVPPLAVGSLGIDPTLVPDEPEATVDGQPGRYVEFPPATYLFGMAAMEHSARWGRRLLNYGLVKEAIAVLQDKKAIEDEASRKRIKSIIGSWLDAWKTQIRNAIPKEIPGVIPALKAISRAESLSKPGEKVFTSNSFNIRDMSEPTVSNFSTYLSSATGTYTRSAPGQTTTDQAVSSSALTLQDSMDCIPQIEQEIQSWDDKDIGLKMQSPLVKAKVMAQRILSQPGFFAGSGGAVPRAILELRELGNSIGIFQDEHHKQSLNLSEKQEELQKKGESAIENFKAKADRWPWLAQSPVVSTAMKVCTLVAIILFMVWAILLAYAALGQAVSNPENLFLISFSIPVYIIFWAVLVVGACIILYRSWKWLFSEDRKKSEIEIAFWLLLLFVSIVGLVITLAFQQFSSNALSVSLLFLPAVFFGFYIIAFSLALLILILETWSYFVHVGEIKQLRERLLNELRQQHNSDIQAVRRWIADELALRMLQEVGLTHAKNGSPGFYATRIGNLNSQLEKVEKRATGERELATKRLAVSLSDKQEGTKPTKGGDWGNLQIRKEIMDVDALAKGFYDLRRSLIRGQEDFVELAELLLRIMGQETPIMIEDDFRSRLIQNNQEPRQAYLLMSLLVATILLSTIDTLDDDYMLALTERLPSIDYPPPALSALIEKVTKKINKSTQDRFLSMPASQKNAWAATTDSAQIDPGTILAADALANWEQMLWEDKNEALDEAVSQDGILAKLEGKQDAPAVIRTLRARLSLFGRPLQKTPLGEIFLLMAPSQQSFEFRQNLTIPDRNIIEFPDSERIILLYVQHYRINPVFIPGNSASLLAEPSAVATLSVGGASDATGASGTLGAPGTAGASDATGASGTSGGSPI